MPKLQLPKIPESEKTPWVIKLLSFIGELFLGIEKLKAEIQQLKDEISDLKKHHNIVDPIVQTKIDFIYVRFIQSKSLLE